MSVRVLLAGGGTGGHVFPLIAVAEALRLREPDAEITFVGTAKGMEARLLPARGERLELMEILPIKGRGLFGALKGVGKAASSLPYARELINRLRPQVVLSVGGYAAGPVTLAAWTKGIPATMLEPNAVLGLTNRLQKPFVKRAYLTFRELAEEFPTDVARVWGLPLRQEFAPSAYPADEAELRVLVLGGSQGALPLNEAVPGAFAIARGVIPTVKITHQTGCGKAGAVRAAYEKLGVQDHANVTEFIDDVPKELARAHLVIARAGAGTIAEICTIGRAAIYVPFPFAADDHQRRNAETLQGAGAGRFILQRDATVARLGEELLALLKAPDERRTMADKARDRVSRHAATQLADDLLAFVRGGNIPAEELS